MLVRDHVVMFSGGIGSWACAKRVAQAHGTANMTLLFADVKGNSTNPHIGEDEDTYRFLDQAARNVGAPLVIVSDGRTIWDVFEDHKFLSNSRLAHCSIDLKRTPTQQWLKHNRCPQSTIVYLGIDWSEIARAERARQNNKPYTTEFPLLQKPLLDKQQMVDWARNEGLEPPRLYKYGFAHNNCGGGCVKSGISQFIKLLRVMPERYAVWEKQEHNIATLIGKPVSILRQRTGAKSQSLTLQRLRERIEAQPNFEDTAFDFGSCQCFV
jgi:hypothetical protein